MGVIICKKHGRQFFLEVCGHVNKYFEENKFGEIYKMPLGILICKDCKNRIKLEEFGDLTIEENIVLDFEKKIKKMYGQINRKIICIECANEIQFLQKMKAIK